MKIRQRKRKARKRRKMEKSKIHDMETDEENVRGKQKVKKVRKRIRNRTTKGYIL